MPEHQRTFLAEENQTSFNSFYFEFFHTKAVELEDRISAINTLYSSIFLVIAIINQESVLTGTYFDPTCKQKVDMK